MAISLPDYLRSKGFSSLRNEDTDYQDVWRQPYRNVDEGDERYAGPSMADLTAKFNANPNNPFLGTRFDNLVPGLMEQLHGSAGYIAPATRSRWGIGGGHGELQSLDDFYGGLPPESEDAGARWSVTPSPETRARRAAFEAKYPGQYQLSPNQVVFRDGRIGLKQAAGRAGEYVEFPDKVRRDPEYGYITDVGNDAVAGEKASDRNFWAFVATALGGALGAAGTAGAAGSAGTAGAAGSAGTLGSTWAGLSPLARGAVMGGVKGALGGGGIKGALTGAAMGGLGSAAGGGFGMGDAGGGSGWAAGVDAADMAAGTAASGDWMGGGSGWAASTDAADMQAGLDASGTGGGTGFSNYAAAVDAADLERGAAIPERSMLDSVKQLGRDIWGDPVGKTMVQGGVKAAVSGLFGGGDAPAAGAGSGQARLIGGDSESAFNKQMLGLAAAGAVGSFSGGSASALPTAPPSRAALGGASTAPEPSVSYLSGARGAVSPESTIASMNRPAGDPNQYTGGVVDMRRSSPGGRQSGAVNLGTRPKMFV